MTDFVGLGYCSNDYLCKVTEIPIDHKVEMLSHEIQGGGPAADATVVAARLGLSCAFVTSVGCDEAGKKIIADLESEHIDTTQIRIRDTGGSPISYCWIDAAGHRSVVWTRNGLIWLGADEIPADLIANAKILHIDGHHPEAAMAAAKLANAKKVLVSYDAGTFRPNTAELIPTADIFITSEFFARTFAEVEDLKKALEKLRNANKRAVVVGITRGSAGSLFWTDNGIIEIPAFSNIEVVDTTGAGDAFHGAFAVEWVTQSNPDIASCAYFASAVAALKCGKLGARAGLPTRDQVLAFLKDRS